MKKGLYCIYDELTKEFSAPTVHKNDAAAGRAFAQALTRLPSSKDLSLWCVGKFDEECFESPIENIEPFAVPVEFYKGDDIS